MRLEPSRLLNFKIDLKSRFVFTAYMFCKFGQGDEIICLHTFQIIPLRIVDILQRAITVTNSDY